MTVAIKAGQMSAPDYAQHLIERFFLHPPGRPRSLILSDKLVSNIASSLSQCAPECHDCVFESHCGADPVYHHATHGDPLGIKPLSGFCQRQKGVMSTILDLLDNSPEEAAVLRSWSMM